MMMTDELLRAKDNLGVTYGEQMIYAVMMNWVKCMNVKNVDY